MGLLLSTQLNTLVVEYLRSLLDGQDVYTLDKYEMEFPLNKLPGSDNAPKCHSLIKNCSIKFHDMHFDSEPLSMKSTKICIEIGEAVVRCDDLDYSLKVSGRITVFDVFVNASFTPILENGISISDIDSKATVKNIKSEIELHVNETDHSRLANALLFVENSDVASNLLNALFALQKDNIKNIINENIRDVASQYGL